MKWEGNRESSNVEDGRDGSGGGGGFGLGGRSIGVGSIVSALVGGLLQIAKSEDTRRIAAGISATFTVGLGGWEATLEDGEPLSKRAETIAQERVQLQRVLNRFIRRYGESVSREALLGASYEGDYQDLFDMLTGPARQTSATSIMLAPLAVGATARR